MQSNSFYDLRAEAIDGTIIDFSRYRGKKLLIVNTASQCGYTPQYEDLQVLHEAFGDKITILGFPANNFGAQEPGTNDEILEFCKTNYGVSFQMFSKIDVIGSNQHPVYQWLTNSSLNGRNKLAPTWNFCKYLIDENGEFVNFHGAGTNPGESAIFDFINGN